MLFKSLFEKLQGCEEGKILRDQLLLSSLSSDICSHLNDTTSVCEATDKIAALQAIQEGLKALGDGSHKVNTINGYSVVIQGGKMKVIA